MEWNGKEGRFRLTPEWTEQRSAPQKEITLVVVEEALVSKLVRTVLRKHGYSVVSANPSDATGILRSAGASDEILLTNTPARFLEFAETVPLLYLTSFPDPEVQGAFRSCRVVRKPFSPSELVEAVAKLSGN